MFGLWVREFLACASLAKNSCTHLKEWIEKSACFHAQQCVEKYLKAVLVNHATPFAKSHDLLPLLTACLTHHAVWQAWHEDVEWLSQCAVQFRYPGESATREDAKKAIGIMKALCPDLRHALRLKA